MMYYAGFDVSLLSLGTLTLTTSGQTNATVTMTAVSGTDQNGDTTYRHLHYSDASGYDVFGEDKDATQHLLKYSTTGFWQNMKAAVQAAISAQSWPGTFDLTWDNNDGSTTWSYSAAAFTLAWSTAAGRQLCGFSASQSGASSYNSDIVADYMISPTLTAVSVSGPHESLNYEPGGIANRVVDDGGEGYSQARATSPLMRDWVQQYETKAKTLRLSADETSHPWSFQALIEHCREGFPFAVHSGGFGSVYTTEVFALRSESTSFAPLRATTAWDSSFHIPFQCYVEGYVQGPS